MWVNFTFAEKSSETVHTRHAIPPLLISLLRRRSRLLILPPHNINNLPPRSPTAQTLLPRLPNPASETRPLPLILDRIGKICPRAQRVLDPGVPQPQWRSLRLGCYRVQAGLGEKR